MVDWIDKIPMTWNLSNNTVNVLWAHNLLRDWVIKYDNYFLLCISIMIDGINLSNTAVNVFLAHNLSKYWVSAKEDFL